MVVDNTYSFVIPATYKSDASKVQASDIEVSVKFQKATEVAEKSEDDGFNVKGLIIGLAAALALAIIALILAIIAQRKRRSGN